MIVDLIRHGEPVGGRRYRGQVDDPLSDRGWQQMWSAVEATQPWEVIITSTLSRCREFAWALGDRLSLPVNEEPRLVEIGFGEWEGHTGAEINSSDPDRVLNFLNNPIAHRPAGAEPLDEFSARVVATWASVLEQYQDQHILIVAHAGVIRAIITHVLGIPVERLFRLQVGNAGISRVQVDAGRPPVLVMHNGRL